MIIIDKVLAPEGEYKFSFGSELYESEKFFSKELVPTTSQKYLISQFEYYKKNLSLPMYVSLKKNNIKYICNTLKNIILK